MGGQDLDFAGAGPEGERGRLRPEETVKKMEISWDLNGGIIEGFEFGFETNLISGINKIWGIFEDVELKKNKG